jgi:hypothetical protein
LTGLPDALGAATKITRGDLEWQISIPADGSLPWEGALPTLIEWPVGQHPATRMVDLGLRLIRLEVHTPQASQIKALLDDKLSDSRIVFIQGEDVRLRAEFDGADGQKRILF